MIKTPKLSKELQRKAADKGIDKNRSQNAATDFLLRQYRNSNNHHNNKERLLHDFYTMRRDIAERAKLQAMDTGAEVVLSPREMSARAAARAGLQLPKLHNDKND